MGWSATELHNKAILSFVKILWGLCESWGRQIFAFVSVAESIGVFSTTFTQSAPKATEFGEITLRLGLLRRLKSSKVTEFGTNRKLIYDLSH